MPGRIAALYRHPVKGFTPEQLGEALLQAGAVFPCDRLYAVENGPSGYDPALPVFLPKTRFTVLSNVPTLARARTRYDEASGVLSVEADGFSPLETCLKTGAGRNAFAAWLTGFIPPDQQNGALRVLVAAGPHRFTDDRAGAVSLINLASVRDLSAKLGREIDPLRFRANLYVEGWEPWAELNLANRAEMQVGDAVLRVIGPIMRCAATHVDPTTGERDLDLVPSLHALYGRLTCGIYLRTIWGGRIGEGDSVRPEGSGLRLPPKPAGEPLIRRLIPRL